MNIKNNIILFVLLLFIGSYSFAQNTAPDNEIIEHDMAGYDTNAYHPLFIQSPDGQFKLNIGFYTQIRYNMNWRENTPDTVDERTRGYNMARTRIFFEGDLTDKFYYHFRTNINPSGNWEMFVAYLQWNIHKKWNLRMGKQFMALGREDWIYAQDIASIDFSAHDFTYAIWTSFGIQLRHVPTDYFRYWLGVGNGSYGGRRQFPAPSDSDLGLTSRLEWNLFSSDWSDWDDLTGRPGQEFGILFGIGLGYQYRFDKEVIKTESEYASQINADFSVAGNRFHFFSHASMTNRFYSNDNVLSDKQSSGFYSSLGYWVTKKLFLYGRYDVVSPDSEIGKEQYNSPGIGLSIYPLQWTRRTRITVEYNRLKPILNNTIVEPDGQLGLVESSYGGQQSLRFQLQFGF